MQPEVSALFQSFQHRHDEPVCEIVAADQVPSPYHDLLVHDQHMTVAVERFYNDRVDVRVLETSHHGSQYARKILLALQSTGQVVQFGIPRIHLELCRPDVRSAILEEKLPLGRILIDHDVFRRIEPTAYLLVHPGPGTSHWFGPNNAAITYGRLAQIHCDGKEAIDLLEILAPIASA